MLNYIDKRREIKRRMKGLGERMEMGVEEERSICRCVVRGRGRRRRG